MEHSEETGNVLQIFVNSLSGDPMAEISVKSSSDVAEVAELLEQKVPPPRRTRYKLLSEDGIKTGDCKLHSFVHGGSCSLTACVEPIPWRFPEGEHSGRFCLSAIERQDDGEDKTTIRRLEGQGVVACSLDPIPVIEGVAAFEVVINEMDRSGASEGVEIGITDSPPDKVLMHQGYAVLAKSSWVSSDAGCLWIHGNKQYKQPVWSETKPNQLKAGDVVQLTVFPDGCLQIDVNGRLQAEWNADIPRETPLYALVGLRAPCQVVTAQLPR